MTALRTHHRPRVAGRGWGGGCRRGGPRRWLRVRRRDDGGRRQRCGRRLGSRRRRRTGNGRPRSGPSRPPGNGDRAPEGQSSPGRGRQPGRRSCGRRYEPGSRAHSVRRRLRRERLWRDVARQLRATSETKLVVVLIVLRALRTGDHSGLRARPSSPNRVSTALTGGSRELRRPPFFAGRRQRVGQGSGEPQRKGFERAPRDSGSNGPSDGSTAGSAVREPAR